jgi:hypothetical protein
MSAETLRRAAALMRGRAEAATRGPWESGEYGHLSRSGAGAGRLAFGKVEWRPDAEHIASWHPAVALAVADWLDETALRWEWVEERELALAAARAYLGSAA